MTELPAFDDLPLRKDGIPGNAWGLFGDNDECGMLNLLTPETVHEATKEIQAGLRIATDLPLDFISQPLFGRAPFQQTITNKAPRQVNDDMLHFNTQGSSQWDGFRHYAHQASGKYFNGHTLDEILETKVNGIGGESCSNVRCMHTSRHTDGRGENSMGRERRNSRTRSTAGLRLMG